VTGLPPIDQEYYAPAIETMPRADLEAMQEERLLEIVPFAYERSALVRETWDAAGVHPRDVKSIDDFKERAPFLDKNMVRRYRDDHCDPYGGTLCVEPSELTGVSSTSGTTGDPTLVPELWGGGPSTPSIITRDLWGWGVRPGDYVALVLFTFRGPTYGLFQHTLGTTPILFDFAPHEMERFCELSLELRPTAVYNFGSVLINAVKDVCDRRGFDPHDVFASYKGVTFAGEPLSPRARAIAEQWGIELFEHGNVGDVTGCFECREHDGMHFWEDTVFVEGVDSEATGGERSGETTHSQGVDTDGDRCELVATSLNNHVAPLLRYRSDDIVRLSTEECGCGRTHARMWPVGRKSDEVVVDGRSVLPIDVWAAVETVDGCAMGLFQVIRTAREVDRLRLRVGYASDTTSGIGTVHDEVQAAVQAAIGVVPDVELVPNDVLLAMGPPHKIPRVARA
jgi:phenylacetate-CoA ligase